MIHGRGQTESCPLCKSGFRGKLLEDAPPGREAAAFISQGVGPDAREEVNIQQERWASQ